MSNQLPSTEVLAAEAEEQKRNEMRFLSGLDGLEIFTAELREQGIELPKDAIWKHASKKSIEASMFAAFQMLGGVPAMTLWAHKNPTAFYSAWMKNAPMETTVTGGGNVFINTAVPSSPLDEGEIDSMGRMIEFKDIN